MKITQSKYGIAVYSTTTIDDFKLLYLFQKNNKKHLRLNVSYFYPKINLFINCKTKAKKIVSITSTTYHYQKEKNINKLSQGRFVYFAVFFGCTVCVPLAAYRHMHICTIPFFVLMCNNTVQIYECVCALGGNECKLSIFP